MRKTVVGCRLRVVGGDVKSEPLPDRAPRTAHDDEVQP